jgi:hypothetical protein
MNRVMKQSCRLLLLYFVAGLGVHGGVARSEELLRRVPASANALLVIDAKALESTPLAVQQGWKQKLEAANAERPLMLPPEADRIVVASQLDMSGNLEVVWELAVMQLSEPLAMRSIARAEGGYLDKIHGFESVWTPSEAYFVALEPSVLGVLFPANRQLVSRWAQLSQTNSVAPVTKYLAAAEKSVDRDHPIVLALDLEDAPRPHRLREALQQSAALRGSEAKFDPFAKLISGIQGITVRLAIDKAARGTLRVDFSESPQVLGTLAKPLLLETLNKYGAHLPDLDQWTMKIQGNAVVLDGTFSTDGLRRLFSLLEIPSTKFSTLKSEDVEKSSPTSVAQASRTYFKSVTVLVEDLRKTLGETRDNHAVWMERYARKVDGLPILNVDEALLAYGANVGETFRAMAIAERSGNLKAGARKSSVYGNYQYNYDQYGYGTARTTPSVKNQIVTEERAKAKAVRFTSWKEIEDATAAMRKEMTKRFQMEF